MFGHGVEFSFEVTALYQALEHVLLLHFFPLFVNFEFDQIFNGRFLFELEGFQSAVWALVVDLFDVQRAEQFVAPDAADGFFTEVETDNTIVVHGLDYFESIEL